MSRSTVRNMTEGSPLKLILRFSAPLLFGMLLQRIYSFVDAALVGKTLGASALAAVGATGSLSFLIINFTNGLCSGFAIPIAQAFGAKDGERMRRSVMHSAYLSAVFSIVIGMTAGIMCSRLLVMMDTPPEILADATVYIRTVFFAMPATALYNMTAGVMRALGDSKTPVVFVSIAAVMNVVLDLIFILVFHMGVFGAALATAISQLFSGVGCLLVLIFRFPLLRMTWEDMRFRGSYAGHLLKMGLPFGLQFSITGIGSVIMQTAVNGLGTAAVAALTTVDKLSQFLTCPFDALASAMTTFAGQNVGAKKLERITRGLKSAVMMAASHYLLVLAVTWLLNDQMIGLFVNMGEGDVIALAKQYLSVVSISYILVAFVSLLRLTIQGMGFPSAAMLAGIMELLARFLVAKVLIVAFGFGGACWGNPTAWLFADIFLIPCYAFCIRRLRQRMQSDACLAETDML